MTAAAGHHDSAGELQPGLRRRHMTMISLGGVIGAGRFVGSGAVMNQTGPAAFAHTAGKSPEPAPSERRPHGRGPAATPS